MRAPGWLRLARYLAFSSFAASSAAAMMAAGSFSLASFLTEAHEMMPGLADWLVLPLYLAGAFLIGSLAGLIGNIFVLPISLPLASLVIAIMARAERGFAPFRQSRYWCVLSLLLMPIPIFRLSQVLTVDTSWETTGLDWFRLFHLFMLPAGWERVLDWPWVGIVGLPGALAGAIVGRHCWHAFAGLEAPLDDEPIEATSLPS